MNLQGLGPQNSHSVGRMEQQQKLENHEKKTSIRDAILASGDSEIKEPSAEETGTTKGVIRNIKDGNFKGVADIRLRINFHEELEAERSQEVARQIEEEAGNLDAKVAEKVLELKEHFEFASEFAYSFSFSATIYNSPIPGGIGLDDQETADVSFNMDMFRKTFDDVYDALSALTLTGENDRQDLPAITGEEDDAANLVETAVSLSAPSETVAEPEPAAVSTSEVSAFQSALGDLRSFFENELQSIEKRLNDVLALPTLSRPRGNGLAYDRFLNMYNELSGLTKNSTENVSPDGDDWIETHA